ncbi:MAG: ABC-type transport auxiliary lipoprotein family protein [Burkholderiaceae bacterium]
MNASIRLLLTAAAALLTACAAPAPPRVLLTLPSAVPIDAPAAAPVPASAPLLVVRRVNLPEYLVSRRVRYRADPSTLAEWPNTYWAERMEIGVSREFIAALQQQLPGWALCVEHCGDGQAALVLGLDLVPMDFVRSARQLQARAHLTLSSPGPAPRVLQTQERPYTVAAQADGPQGQAQAVTELIRQVAQAAGAMVRASRP